MRKWFIVYRLLAIKGNPVGTGYERVSAGTAIGAIAKFMETHPDHDVISVHLDEPGGLEGMGLPTGPDPTKEKVG